MKNLKRIFILAAFIFLFYQTSNSQWQYCGSYTGYVLPFAAKDSVLIAGTYGSGIYYTTDGINWSYTTNGMTDLKILSLTVSGNNVFAGSETGGVYRSTDNGVNWTPVNNGLTSFEIHTICSNAGKVYSGTNTGAFMTSDNGANWELVSTGNVGSIIFAILAYDNKIIATSINGVFISSNGGTNWSNITSGTGGSIYCLTRYGNAVYAGSSSYGVYKTTNDGLNWIQLNTGLPSGRAVRSIFCEDDKIYAALYNSGGIYYLPSSASRWLPANEGLTQQSCYTVIAFKNYVFAGTLSGIFRRLKSEFSSIIKIDKQIPGDYRLFNNYPNPFNSQTVIKFSIPGNINIHDKVRLELFDITGKLARCLLNENLSAGIYEFKYNAGELASGSYFIRLSNGPASVVNKIMLIK